MQPTEGNNDGYLPLPTRSGPVGGQTGIHHVLPQYDQCLFITKDVIVLCYVDDCIFFSKNESAIGDVIESLRNGTIPEGVQTTKSELRKFHLCVEEDYAGFLGIDNQKKEDGSIELLQMGLIDRILIVLDLDEECVATKTTPTVTETLGKYENRPHRQDS
mmetsp:Transcript_26908/g.38168  ORF Transcript_26908/g.38168 Transcript_26908/m.38168 type:complete len:160 (+) Transcript_26908:874-1353(+)